MATYKFIGQRYLRKYTASRATPVYAASTDAQAIVNNLCSVAWTKVSERDATMTYHTDEAVKTIDNGDGTKTEISGLDMNVQIRDEFDAALFCAGHEGGMHRAYANAAVYVYALPSAAVGKTLTSLAASVTSDPYNSKGCRLHVWTGDALAIPTSCNDVRGCDSSGADLTDGTVAAGVAVRTEKPVVTGYSKTGQEITTTYWYPTTATATLTPTGGMTLKKYLFLAVVMESYSTTRGNWIEGCSYIANKVSVTLDSDVADWTDGETYNLALDGATPHELAVLRGGIVPCVPTGSCTGSRSVAVRADADLLAEADGSQSAAVEADGENAAAAANRLYAEFYAANDAPTVATASTPQTGVVFNVTRTVEDHFADDTDTPVTTDVLRIDSRVLVVPFAYPKGFVAKTLRVEYSAPTFSAGTSVRVYLSRSYATSLSAGKLKDSGLYVGSSSLDGLEYLGDLNLESTVTELAIDQGSELSGTIVFAAFLNPECVDLTAFTPQGTGDAPFMPKITICE